ncbi:MAG TPA: FtsQ-type POTRA domain-containing protein [Promineifilum sp.]|nr:FtsQ-type POTRA domain-containing protein [Promineifilum sp.]
MKQRQEQPKPRLRKQPRMRRLNTASVAPLPALTPEARTAQKKAQKRKRRNSQERLRRPLSGIVGLIVNTRWISLAVLAACVYTLYIIGSDDRFYLNVIPVEGASSLDINHVVEESGLAGQHIFAADPQEAADRLSEMGGVVTATVTLRWPNDVLITLREQPPLATWQEGDQSYWVDADGGLSPARAQTIGLLNIISEIPVAADGAPAAKTMTADDSNAGAIVAAEEDASDEAGATADPGDGADAQIAFLPQDVLEGALQLRSLRPNIEQLYYRPSGGLSYQDGRGWRAYFGTGRDMNQKLAVYETVVAKLLEQGIRPEYISVSNQYKPYYRALP